MREGTVGGRSKGEREIHSFWTDRVSRSREGKRDDIWWITRRRTGATDRWAISAATRGEQGSKAGSSPPTEALTVQGV